jgi:hypothetical protein
MGHPVVHFEIISNMAEKLQEFYSKVFGWSVDTNNPMNYGIVNTNAGTGINGGIGPVMQGNPYVAIYVAVPSLDDTLEKAQKLGGTVMMPAMEVMPDLTIAFVGDPEGNGIGLILDAGQAAEGPAKGKGRAVDWFEIAGKDANALHTFYGELFEWNLDADNEWNYAQYKAEGRGISGGIGPAQGEPYVTFYVSVLDLVKALADVNAAGGKTVMEPMSVGEDTEVAQFRDPEGHLIGLYKGMP